MVNVASACGYTDTNYKGERVWNGSCRISEHFFVCVGVCSVVGEIMERPAKVFLRAEARGRRRVFRLRLHVSHDTVFFF